MTTHSIARIKEVTYEGLVSSSEARIAKCFDRAKCFDAPATQGTIIRRAGQQNAALQYKNPKVVRRIAQECNVSEEVAEAIFLETKTYLWQSAQGRKPTNPTVTVDEGWHAFILHTEDYADYCEHYLGRFIHHVPD